jgi:hypothetical protein
MGNISEKLLRYFLLYGADVLAILVAVLALWRRGTRRSAWLWCAAALLGMVFVARTVCFFGDIETWPYDFKHLWDAGAYALEGKDPYSIKGMLPPNDDLPALIYLPSALPFFKLFALAPLSTAWRGWIAVNVLICLSLGFFARRALIAQDGQESAVICPALAAVLSAPVILSLASNFCMDDGHLSFLVTLALLGALTTQMSQPSRPVLTAALLALASLKPQTMLPFLLLFLRRRDFKVWLFLGLMGAALLLAAGDPADLPHKFSAFFEASAANREPGRTNDNSMLNPFANTLFGFEHLFYRLGIAHRQTVTVLAVTCVLGLGAWVAYLINIKGTRPRGACCALVSLYSMLFIYHRLYDLSILILPLFYSASRLHSVSRPARWCHAWVITAILLVLNAPYGEFLRLQTLYSSSAIVRILVLPSATYLILSAMAALIAATALEARRHSAVGSLTPEGKESRPGIAFAGQTA